MNCPVRYAMHNGCDKVNAIYLSYVCKMQTAIDMMCDEVQSKQQHNFKSKKKNIIMTYKPNKTAEYI